MFGLIGDLADSFPNGQLKRLLLQEWFASELRNKRGLSAEAKKTMRWAKEVSHVLTFFSSLQAYVAFPADDQAGYRVDNFEISVSFSIFHFPFISRLFSVHATYIPFLIRRLAI